MIPESEWKWFGNAAHLCVGNWCQFHLATQVGNYLISTVGQYFPDSQVRESFAISRGSVLEGRGDERYDDYLRKIGYEEIGYGRTFETMVFPAGPVCTVPECGCGMPQIGGAELDMEGYNTAGEATEGHLRLCRKWAKQP